MMELVRSNIRLVADPRRYLVDDNRIVYSLEKQMVVGVTSHADTRDMRCGVWQLKPHQV